MKKLLLLSCIILSLISCNQQANRIDLSGEWTVEIDSTGYKITLPGSLAENGIGNPPKDSATHVLTETFSYQGAAWYEKEIDIPSSWEGRPVELYMERTKVSEVFINGTSLGSQNSVSAPQVYISQTLFKAGKNSIRIKIDNTKSLLPLGGSHAYSEHTQTNWNGILGNFYLKVLPDITIDRIETYASVNGNCRIKLFLANYTASICSGQKIRISAANHTDKAVAQLETSVDLPPGKSEHHVDIDIPNPQLWDEYTPSLYHFKVEIPGNDSKSIRIGFRDFTTRGTQFSNNGRTVYLRGKNECGTFPLTGYASMSVDDWKRYFSIARSYGINHVRFHSWTPPQAAFDAADETGVFLQPELPLWGTYHANDTLLISYMKNEGHRIMQEYGNHPSFVMFSLGNELEGDTAVMAGIVKELKEADCRHLYALGTNNHYWNPQTHPLEDFFVAMRHGKVAADNSTDLRGSFSFADSDQGGIINCLSPNTLRDFSSASRNLGKPTIGHETGQYQVYPNYEEISKYTGVLRPLNLMVFRQRLEQAGMGAQANEFLKASGALAALCYREEIEMSLRTPGFGGFQLLDLQDYPGQGTALVGMLDAFMESKGIIAPDKWTEFCNDVVPLARFPKYCWNTDETFTADIQVANYGQTDIAGEKVLCSLSTESGEVIYRKDLRTESVPQGRLTTLASISIPLKDIREATRLTFRILLEGSGYVNAWNIWVYPRFEGSRMAEGDFNGVTVTREKALFDELHATGKPVLYIPREKDIKDKSVGGLFITDFWNYKVFRGVAESLGIEPSPGTLGLFIGNTRHGIFNSFPTDSHTNWQWWNIIKNSRPVMLDDMPAGYLPIVQVIDNFERNHKLGLIYQLPGSKALVCSSDLFACSDKPEVKALFFSLIKYLQP